MNTDVRIITELYVQDTFNMPPNSRDY